MSTLDQSAAEAMKIELNGEEFDPDKLRTGIEKKVTYQENGYKRRIVRTIRLWFDDWVSADFPHSKGESVDVYVQPPHNGRLKLECKVLDMFQSPDVSYTSEDRLFVLLCSEVEKEREYFGEEGMLMYDEDGNVDEIVTGNNRFTRRDGSWEEKF